MNKQKFVDYLRSPERLTEGQFDELQKVLTDYPYFSIAKSIAARSAKDLELDIKTQLISSAAIYATDRKHLKKYINGELVFLADTPIVNEEVNEEITSKIDVKDSQPANEEIAGVESVQHTSNESILNGITTHVPTGNEVDQVLDELQRDIKELEKSRMHFLEVQDHLDDAKFTNKVKADLEDSESSTTIVDTPAVPSDLDEVAAEEETNKAAVQDEEVSKEEITEIEVRDEAEEVITESTKKNKKPEFTLDLEALKREFALESDSTDKNEPIKDQGPIIIGNMDDEDDEDDADFFPPPPTDSPNSITNMSPDEEEPDDEAEIIQKLPQKSKRKPRKATKMKRDDFEKILGKMPEIAKPSEEKNEEEKPVVEENTAPEIVKEIHEPTTPELIETNEVPEVAKIEKPKKVEKLKDKKTDNPESEVQIEQTEIVVTKEETTDKVKEAMSKMDKASSISKSQSKRTTKKKLPKKDLEENSAPIEIIKSVPKKASKKEKNPKQEDNSEENQEMTGRNSIKSFLELGRSNESTSISRASVSKKRSRTNKPKSSSDSSTSSGSKDDDESGGANALIDKFITENPSIQRRDAKDEIADLSQESVKWHSELASEYLAQIYADQGNKARAISIYEALSLKFPEKKSYFAGLIKKLKK